MITKIKIQGYRIYSDFTLLPNSKRFINPTDFKMANALS